MIPWDGGGRSSRSARRPSATAAARRATPSRWDACSSRHLGEDEFLVTGYLCRVDFEVADEPSGARREFLRVEEGHHEGGVFRPQRIWNGDETDWALNFGTDAQVLRVQLGRY